MLTKISAISIVKKNLLKWNQKKLIKIIKIKNADEEDKNSLGMFTEWIKTIKWRRLNI